MKDGKSIKTTNKHKLNNKKILLLKERFQKQRFSYPQIKIINNSRKNVPQIFLKNNNNFFSNISIINKSINDFDRTTVSSLNDKTIEIEKLMNNTIWKIYEYNSIIYLLFFIYIYVNIIIFLL